MMGRPIRDLRREAEVRDSYAARLVPTGWSTSGLDQLLHALLAASRRMQMRVRISIQGGRGSWSEESLQATLPGCKVLRRPTCATAWQAVQEGHAVAAWLPVRNSITGPIPATRRVVRSADVWHEAPYRVRHALVARSPLRLRDVETVVGHPQALRQCARTLRRRLPQATLGCDVDGAHAAWSLAPGSRTAVLASPRLADHGFHVVAADVADQRSNTTWFRLLVPREPDVRRPH